ncbi:hypothetical protein QTG54_001631 [Skeletonema marinoi]|uniref:Tox-ART-HYD1 domain-containing protein n=1 Tax=Skeletonema marinoi TaxID=267567 RepID=A0AAD8YJS0_9STRA|nr:hypothetical protein QTG54_001631 [Skeletonema marinoi]
MNKKLYHFTTLEAYYNIERVDFIRSSSSGKYGPGVYLTDLDQNEHSVEKISEALYNAGAEKNLRAGKLDHYISFDISGIHVKEERPHVYRYVGGNELCLSRHRVISRGLIQEIGSELFTAAAAVTAGAALYSHATDGRMARTQELKTSLQTFLRSTAASSKYIPVVSKNGGSVQVCCSEQLLACVGCLSRRIYLFLDNC